MKAACILTICLTVGCMPWCACRKSASAGASAGTMSVVFEQFWDSMSTHYVYWETDPTDWDAMYRQYQPLFALLHDDDSADLRTSVGYYRAMTAGLIDGHYSIGFTAGAIRDSIVFPALARRIAKGIDHAPFSYWRLDTAWLDKPYEAGVYTSVTGDPITAVCGTIQGHILYFTCSGFHLQEACMAASANGVRTTVQAFSDWLRSGQIDALILDVRNNRGGDLADLSFLIGRLIDRPLIIGQARYKNGPGRTDLTSWIDASVQPQAGASAFLHPVLVLADEYSMSLAEAVVMAVHALPGGRSLGETTWGATGPITSEDLYNSGPFAISGALSVYTSAAAFRYLDGRSYEGTGFPPDIPVPYQWDRLSSGMDPALDKALQLLR